MCQTFFVSASCTKNAFNYYVCTKRIKLGWGSVMSMRTLACNFFLLSVQFINKLQYLQFFGSFIKIPVLLKIFILKNYISAVRLICDLIRLLNFLLKESCFHGYEYLDMHYEFCADVCDNINAILQSSCVACDKINIFCLTCFFIQKTYLKFV